MNSNTISASPAHLFTEKLIGASINRHFAEADAAHDEVEKKEVLVFVANDAPEAANWPIIIEKLLIACGIDLAQSALYFITSESTYSWPVWKRKHDPEYVFCFGQVLPQIGVQAQLAPHRVHRFQGCQWIVTAPLSVLEKDENIKRHLWNQMLKPLFKP